jgi:hypothetical protein
MRNVSEKVVEKTKTHILFSIEPPHPPPRKSWRLLHNVEKYVTAREVIHNNKTRRMRFASWTTNATDTHSEYAIRIAFPRQQWLRERASILCYMNAACIGMLYLRQISYV